MKSSKLLLAASLIGLCSIQGVNAFGLSDFFSGFSTMFSRIKPTYNRNEPYYGLNTRDNIPHAIAVGGTGIFSGWLVRRWWQLPRKKQLTEQVVTLAQPTTLKPVELKTASLQTKAATTKDSAILTAAQAQAPTKPYIMWAGLDQTELAEMRNLESRQDLTQKVSTKWIQTKTSPSADKQRELSNIYEFYDRDGKSVAKYMLHPNVRGGITNQGF